MAADKLDSTVATPSHSRLSKFHECRRAYWYRYVQGLRSPRQATKPLAGKAGHAGLDVLHRLGWQALPLAQSAARLAYGEHIPEESLKWLTADHICGILANYAEHWAEDDSDFKIYKLPASIVRQGNPYVKQIQLDGLVDANDNVQMNENPMVIQLSDELAMTVVIDMLITRADGSIWIADHKWTAQYLGKGVLNKYVVSHQMPLYILAARRLIGRCDGAILNAVWMGQAANNPQSGAQKFDRYVFDYTEGQLAESLEWATQTAKLAAAEESAFKASSLGLYWLQNPASYCSGCDYLKLCEVAPAMRPGRVAKWFTHADKVEDAKDEV